MKHLYPRIWAFLSSALLHNKMRVYLKSWPIMGKAVTFLREQTLTLSKAYSHFHNRRFQALPFLLHLMNNRYVRQEEVGRGGEIWTRMTIAVGTNTSPHTSLNVSSCDTATKILAFYHSNQGLKGIFGTDLSTLQTNAFLFHCVFVFCLCVAAELIDLDSVIPLACFIWNLPYWTRFQVNGWTLRHSSSKRGSCRHQMLSQWQFSYNTFPMVVEGQRVIHPIISKGGSQRRTVLRLGHMLDFLSTGL